MTRQHIVFLTGAGVSVDSGLSTFRGKDGLWTNEEWAYLASTEALYNDTQRCLDYYGGRPPIHYGIGLTIKIVEHYYNYDADKDSQGDTGIY